MEYNEIDIQAIRFLTPDGGTLEATQHPEIRCEMPVGTFAVGRMNFCRVSIQVSNTDESVVHSHMGSDTYVSPVIVLEPLRRKFHASPVIRLPLPGYHVKKIDPRSVHVLISVTGSGDCSDWQDIASVIGEERINSAVETGVINIGNVVVSGRFVVVCCDNSIMDVPATVSEMMRSCMNGGLGAAVCRQHVGPCSKCSDQPHLDLLHAARNGDVSALKACLTSEGMDINFTNKGGQSALHLACAEGHTHIVKELLKHDADMTLLSQKGNAPIHLACFNGHGDVVELLLKKGCDINLPSKHSCFPPIYASILETHCEVVKLLLSKGADVTWTSLDGLSLVLVAVYTTYDKERTKALLQILLDHVDISTLHLSKQLKHRGFICHGEALLQCVATRQAAKDLIGPVRLKLANHSTDLIHKDLETCQKAFGDLRSLMLACKEGNLDSVTQFIEERDKLITRVTEAGVSCLHCACHGGHADIVDKLIKAGADVNGLTEHGVSCLYLAAMGGHTNIAKKLLKSGANTDTLNQYGLSASNIATEMGYLNIVSIIKDYSIRNEFRKETSQKTVTASSEKDKEKDEKTVKKCCNIV
ncbi:ankyrin-2-like isoform X2 [Mya arenaria]|uniref:ankyrin-2-like isoform X2 n=1 Tax=Mya arenaria TaxID=6604 RepID=UPI0022E533BB|nr:ankyrin-2-like isoform X2 [Mya arenaria]